jgi:hypothetical protein
MGVCRKNEQVMKNGAVTFGSILALAFKSQRETAAFVVFTE